MKKIFSLFAAILFAGSMMAADAEIAKGTTNSYDDVTVNSLPAVKMGKSGAGGNMTITVGASATTLKFHAAAWKGEGDQTVSIAAPEGVTATPASIVVAANDNLSGSGKAFEVTPEDDYLFTISLEGVGSEGAVLTLTSTKRAFVWSATYETGEAPKVATPVISGDATFTDSVIVTITCSTPEADIYYTIDGTTDPKCDCSAAPEYKNPIVIKETTTIKAAAYTGNDWSAVATKTFTKVAPLTDPTNCAEAAEAALSVSGNNVPYNNGKEYTIEGFVTAIATEWSEQYKNITFWMADTKDGGEVLEAFRAVCETAADAPAVGDKVAVTGKLTKYNTTPEFAAGCTFEILGGEVEEWAEIKFSAADVATAGTLDGKVFTAEGSEFKLTLTDKTSGGRLAIDANTASFGTEEAQVAYTHRLKSGGASSAQNAMELNIPADGKVRIAPRTASGTATDRKLILVQGEDTLYNKVVVEADTLPGRIYPYVTVEAKKGTLQIGYTNGINFYSFAFLAGEAPDTIPTTAPAAPKQDEAYVMAVYSSYYKTKNLDFAISGWAGAYDTLTIEGTKIAYWKGMTWECIIDPVNTDAAHDFSDYKNIHVDMWAPAAAKIKLTAEAVAGGNYKDGIAVNLKKGWNSIDLATAEWPNAYDFKNVKCFVLEQYQTPDGASFEGNPFAFANLYFWNTPAADTLTCAKAAEDALAGKTDEVVVKGYVTEIATEWSAQYKNISFWMADAKDGGKVFEAYRAVCEKEADAPIVGDLVAAAGKLTKYNETPELAAGCTFTIIEKAPRPEPKPTVIADTITVAKAIELGMALDSAATDTVIYAVEGYVINAGSVSLTYMNQSYYMADAADAAASDFQAYNCFAIEGNDTLKVLNGDKVQLVGKLKKYYNRTEQKYIIEIEKGNASFISKTEGDHSIKVVTEEVTVAEALEIGKALADGGVTEKQYKITAYVSAINVKSSDAWSDQYGNQSFWVADDPTSTASTNEDGAFYVYRGKPSTAAEIPVGAKVEFTCTIKKYVPSGGGDVVIENADQNITVTVLEGPVGPELPEGVISCDSAVALAKTIQDPVEVKTTVEGPAVKVWGYVTYAYDLKDGKQSAWLSDTKGSSAGVIQGAYLAAEKAVVKGDYVQIEGTLAKYLKEGKDGKPNEVVIEVINGTIKLVSEIQGIENVVLTEKAQKVIVDGVLYIIRDNKMYNIQGLQVR